MSAPILGCIADDFTGATDLANNLVRAGLRTLQHLGVPAADWQAPPVDALVVALKSRSLPAEEAKALSLEALKALQARGCTHIYFKYCSTFDSTDAGNIGPVADVLMDALSTQRTIHAPAFPDGGRTVYMSHLFVHGRLLNESGMENHPLNPMTDPWLVRVLGRQTRRSVGAVTHTSLLEGSEAVARAVAGSQDAHLIVDTLTNQDLDAIGRAVSDLPLVCGGSGLALGLGEGYRARGLLEKRSDAASLPEVGGPVVVLSGSCSGATQAQVAAFAEAHKSLRIDPLSLSDDPASLDRVFEAAKASVAAEELVLVYATADAEAVSAAQARLGREKAGTVVEEAMASLAGRLAEAGVRRFVVAGGETSGAVVQALGVQALQIGPQIDPGVPATYAQGLGGDGFALALKSGNFGGRDFFEKAIERVR